MQKTDRAGVNGATSQATLALIQSLGALLVNKGIISLSEWSSCAAESALHLRAIPNATPDQKKASELLAAIHLTLSDKEKAQGMH